ncbi:MAG TPA: 5'-nucleotidase C-terminal domain-containing protein, partial [Gammaproteobacteria bacterium]|nr:5'-nucleotidase C-terminal domain-containing protein [Gammaproteobacteria bacterium]
VDNLRAARAADGGALLLLDAGDTFQGGIESNLSEGLMVVDAYNALGYTALAVGNHDFDFGSVDPRSHVAEWLPHALAGADLGDMQGALKAAAARARFPFLAANILDAATQRPVQWPNVAPSTIVTAAGVPLRGLPRGVRIGLLGMMTETGLRQTLAAHAVGLTTSPLAATAAREAASLRERGAELVVLVTHAGGWCGETANPRDLSSCDDESEIFRLVRELPRGTLQAVVAGHTHGTVAHFVDDVPIISVPNFGVQFGRMDLTFDTALRGVSGVHIYEPQRVCSRVEPASGECAVAPAGVAAVYEGSPVVPSANVAAAIEPELTRVRALRAEPLGVIADSAVARGTGNESALGNLFADAVRAAVPEADAALGYGAGRGGIRTDLPAGPLTFGQAYDTFPFDNRITRVELTGAQLERVIALQVPFWIDGRRGLPGLAGIRVALRCDGQEPRVRLTRESGKSVARDEALVVAMASNTVGRFAATAADGEPTIVAVELPVLVRDALAAWLHAHGGHISADDFVAAPRWELPATGCNTESN